MDRDQVFRSIPRGTDSGADRVDPAAAAITKFERVCGEIVRLVKTECTGRMIFFSRSSLERALTQYVAHYHEERNQASGLKLPFIRTRAIGGLIEYGR